MIALLLMELTAIGIFCGLLVVVLASWFFVLRKIDPPPPWAITLKAFHDRLNSLRQQEEISEEDERDLRRYLRLAEKDGAPADNVSTLTEWVDGLCD